MQNTLPVIGKVFLFLYKRRIPVKMSKKRLPEYFIGKAFSFVFMLV